MLIIRSTLTASLTHAVILYLLALQTFGMVQMPRSPFSAARRAADWLGAWWQARHCHGYVAVELCGLHALKHSRTNKQPDFRITVPSSQQNNAH